MGIACSLSTLALSGDYGMNKDNHWPTKKVDYNTPRPTKWSPPSHDWKKPSYPKPTWQKTSKPIKAWKKNPNPTWQKTQKYDHETVEKEAVSHIYNPYDIRQRGIVKAQLEERIESDKQELAALNELETVSDEQQDSADVLLNENGEVREFDDFPFDDSADLNDKDYIGQIAPVYFFGCAGGIANGQSCSSACDCNEGCCEGGRCVAKKRDWAKFLYCPADCVGKIFGSRGTC